MGRSEIIKEKEKEFRECVDKISNFKIKAEAFKQNEDSAGEAYCLSEVIRLTEISKTLNSELMKLKGLLEIE